MNRRTVTTLFAVTAVLALACGPVASDAVVTHAPATLANGVYVHQPAPLLWEVVTVSDDNVSGAAFEWSCSAHSWSAGRIAARIDGGYLQFGDERYAIANGSLDARWRGGIDPRTLPQPTCADASPKPALSADAARELIKQRVTAISPVLVPTLTPDRLSAAVEARADSFTVTYVGDGGVRITLRTAVANPQPVQDGGSQLTLSFREDPHAFYQALDGRSTTTRTLLWTEPASSAAAAAVPYALTTEGVGENEFWRLASSLD